VIDAIRSCVLDLVASVEDKLATAGWQRSTVSGDLVKLQEVLQLMHQEMRLLAEAEHQRIRSAETPQQSALSQSSPSLPGHPNRSESEDRAAAGRRSREYVDGSCQTGVGMGFFEEIATRPSRNSHSASTQTTSSLQQCEESSQIALSDQLGDAIRDAVEFALAGAAKREAELVVDLDRCRNDAQAAAERAAQAEHQARLLSTTLESERKHFKECASTAAVLEIEVESLREGDQAKANALAASLKEVERQLAVSMERYRQTKLERDSVQAEAARLREERTYFARLLEARAREAEASQPPVHAAVQTADGARIRHDASRQSEGAQDSGAESDDHGYSRGGGRQGPGGPRGGESAQKGSEGKPRGLRLDDGKRLSQMLVKERAISEDLRHRLQAAIDASEALSARVGALEQALRGAQVEAARKKTLLTAAKERADKAEKEGESRAGVEAEKDKFLRAQRELQRKSVLVEHLRKEIAELKESTTGGDSNASFLNERLKLAQKEASRKDQVCKELRAKISELHSEAESQANRITKLVAENNRWKAEASRAKMHLATLKDRVEARAKQAQAVRQGDKRPTTSLARRVTDRSQLARRSASPPPQEGVVRTSPEPAPSSFHLPEPSEPLVSPRIPDPETPFGDREDVGATVPDPHHRNDQSRQNSEWWGGPRRSVGGSDEAPMRSVRWSIAGDGRNSETGRGGHTAAPGGGVFSRGQGPDPDYQMPSEIHRSPSRAVADSRSSVDLSESEIAALEDTIRILNLSKEEAADLFMAQFDE